MELNTFFGIVCSVIVIYYAIQLVAIFRLKQPKMTGDPVQTFEDPELGAFTLLMEEPDDWEWTTPMPIGTESTELRVSGLEQPDERILFYARKLKQSLPVYINAIEDALKKEEGRDLLQYNVFTFISPAEPHMLIVRFIADDHQEYECIINSDTLEVSPPSIF